MAAEIISFVPSFLVTFRESLEAVLIIGIVLAYLIKTNQKQYNKFVYYGVGAGIVGSVIAAILFSFIAGGFSGAAEELFEGITMLIGAGLLTWMIFWMMKQSGIAKELQKDVQHKIKTQNEFGLFFLVTIAVLREGVETVIFLNSVALQSGLSLIGAGIGFLAAVVLGFLIFAEIKRINLQTVFLYSSILLILFAAGLVAHGVHEFAELGILPTIVDEVYNINPPVNADGTYPVLHEKGILGSIAKGLFGYNGNPTLIEMLAYVGYLGIVWVYYNKHFRKS